MISHSSNSVGGAETDYIRLLIYFRKRYDVWTAFPNGEKANEITHFSLRSKILPYKYFPYYRIQVIKYFKFFIKSLVSNFILINYLKNNKPNLCILNSSVLFMELLTLSYLKIPTVIFVKEKINPKLIRKFIYMLICLCAKRIIVISNFLKDLFPIDCKKNITTIHSCLEEEFYIKILGNFNFKSKDDDAEYFKLVCVGDFSRLKGQDLLIQSILELDKRNISKKFKLFFIGNIRTDRKFYLKCYALGKELNHKHNILYCNIQSRENTVKTILNADAVVITSREEGQSLVFLEALFLQRPLIASKVGIIPDYLNDGENGLLFDVGNHMQLADKIEQITTDASLYHKIVINGKKTYEDNFDLEKNMEVINKIIEECFER